MKDVIAYRLGEPEIGEVHCAFRDLPTLRHFLNGLPERNIVDLYKVIGKVAEDDGTPDGLKVLVLRYEPFKPNSN